MSAPAAAARSIWARVARTSSVWVLVMVWTETGAAPPITTSPTLMGTVRRRLGRGHLSARSAERWLMSLIVISTTNRIMKARLTAMATACRLGSIGGGGPPRCR